VKAVCKKSRGLWSCVSVVMSCSLLCGVTGLAGEPTGIEVYYDDGSCETWMSWDGTGHGVGVRFSVQQGTFLVGTRIYAWALEACPLGIGVMNDNGEEGAPGELLWGIEEVEIDMGVGFYNVEFPGGIPLTEGEFFIVYFQMTPSPIGGARIGIDTSGVPDGRSWLFEGGSWTLLGPERGDVMIRAVVTEPSGSGVESWGRMKGVYLK